ncbi:FtsQ-type POTRA domain-containing protein [Nocardia sp. NBC_01503]|uniref:cell division protein FtsQ/DivIB n=1 Tax=Nocardia sp. NBC_01503 TaxID=2975997 RepID=UPI002E7C0616|nr:FtsQ-type POTRA domain-containing protein [Nocardia sp. NBC_01503]WTL32518.1 FtsQ-type POTRA domain-containing protein [Nocardia sp. NBC_01503]
MSPGGGADERTGESRDRVDEPAAEQDSAARAARRARLHRGRAHDADRLRNAWRSPRVRIGVAVGCVVLLAIGLTAYFTPVLSVRTVRVDGLSAVPEDQVLDALQVPDGLSMMRIDTTAMAQRVAQLPKVRSVRVQREFPSTVQVTVVERTPVLYFDAPDGPHLVDCDSVEFAIEQPPGTAPKLVTDNPGGNDPATRAAVAVMAVVPPSLGVGQVVARSVSDIALELRDGRTVLWGGTGDSQKKAAVVGPLLTQPGNVFDVSSPNLVTVK